MITQDGVICNIEEIDFDETPRYEWTTLGVKQVGDRTTYLRVMEV